MEIRLMEQVELPAALDLVWKVFEQFEAPEYAPAGVEHFRQYIAPNNIVPAVAEGDMLFFGCFQDGTLLGVLALVRKNHVSLLFVHPDHHRRGFAKALFTAAANHCRRAGAAVMTVNSSPYAVDVYRHLGFLDDGPEQVADGIRFTPMTCTIS